MTRGETEPKICGTCRWWASIDEVCMSADSRHRAEFMLFNETCRNWESCNAKTDKRKWRHGDRHGIPVRD